MGDTVEENKDFVVNIEMLGKAQGRRETFRSFEGLSNVKDDVRICLQ